MTERKINQFTVSSDEHFIYEDRKEKLYTEEELYDLIKMMVIEAKRKSLDATNNLKIPTSDIVKIEYKIQTYDDNYDGERDITFNLIELVAYVSYYETTLQRNARIAQEKEQERKRQEYSKIMKEKRYAEYLELKKEFEEQ